MSTRHGKRLPPEEARERRAPRNALQSLVRSRLDRSAALGLYFTMGLVVAVCALLAFGAVLDAVIDNRALVAWDTSTSLAVHERATPFGLRAFFAISALGSPVTIVSIGVIGLALLWRERRHLLAFAWTAAFVGESVLNQLIKYGVQRDRPMYGKEYLFGASFSFPSGHSMAAVVAYGMIAYTLAHHASFRAIPRVALYGCAAILSLAVGLSRVYLGVHYPSDVLGGFAAGAVWLAVCLTALGVAGRRRGAWPPARLGAR